MHLKNLGRHLVTKAVLTRLSSIGCCLSDTLKIIAVQSKNDPHAKIELD